MKNRLLPVAIPPIKTVRALLLFTSLLWGCSKMIDPYAPSNNPLGEWKPENGGAGGLTNYDSFKNFQYNFKIPSDNQEVKIVLNATIDTRYAIFDTDYNLKVEESSTGKSLSDTYTLRAGTYRLAVTADRRATGRFSLALKGILGGATLIPSKILESRQDFGILGGGGENVTFRNHLFSVDVTEGGTSLDAEIQSDSVDTRLFIYDISSRQFTNTSQGRFPYEIRPVAKQTYLMMATTTVRGNKGSYKLRVTGQVDNLTRIESQSAVVSGQWSANSKVDQNKLAYDEYTLQLSDDSSNLLDLELSSDDTFVELYLQSIGGTGVSNSTQTSSQNKSFKIIQQNLPKGLYKITARTSASAKGKYGTYTLSAFGRFSDFKKL